MSNDGANTTAERLGSGVITVVERVGARLGVLSGDLVAAVDEALRLHLAL